jgi:lactoylglutathione lyase
MSGMAMTPRWTHVALPSADLDESIDFYTTFTPLVVLETREDDGGRSAWLCHRGPTDDPFVLVLVMFSNRAGEKQPMLAPFAHLGFEMPSKSDVDDLAARAKGAGCLIAEPRELPAPIGYICALSDPDGNVVEISFGQGVYEAVQTKWGKREPREPILKQ